MITQFRSFDRSVQLLLLNQFSINVGFYMLMPYLASHLSVTLALAGWAVGLVLGVRNFAQQGMFLIGGTLADRLGYKPLIVAGCALRTGGFALLGLVDGLPALVIASAATGFAGALFNPAVRAYVAADARERRVEAFALFNVFYQTGILVGPLIGLALTAVDFRLTCLVAALVFLVLTVLQWRSLPARAGTPSGDSVLADWRTVFSNRRFVLFAAAMTGSYVLSFQVYLALPLASGSAVLTAVLFAVSGVLAVAGQLRVTAWARARLGPDRSLAAGMLVLGLAFLPAVFGGWAGLILCAALLALGTMVVFPFEMDKIVSLSGDRLVATHYGLYNTVVGVGILLGNLLTGIAFDTAERAGVPWAPWLALTSVGLGCAWSLKKLASRTESELALSTP
ncbi:MFS transporter [Lentzea flava]|uniref:ABC transporter, permease protein n=1 Tax=Lentzea flava TaxID=103732 RepID=A0ABQ2UEB6_9PSEU|nr:MFS transporter [Lentzea flava]MCP2197828.1 putative arabinose efflux permease, MFS family [Lentzea flava]GGU22743.1 putative ABC transporter, permease protein [Lentzea flava]